MSSPTTGAGATAPPLYFCHICSMEIRPLLVPQPTCPRCNESFVEELDSSRDVRENEDEENGGFTGQGSIWSGGPVMMNTSEDGGPGLDLGQFMTGILRNLASGAQQNQNHGMGVQEGQRESEQQQQQNPSDNEEENARRTSGETLQNDNNSRPSSSFRTGTSRFGPVNVTWGVGSSSNVNDILRPRPTSHTPTNDDGMGGAGAASDGRFFNHDNMDVVDGIAPANNWRDGTTPPELSSLRDVFANLFGGMGEGPAGMLMDMFGSALRGGGRSGDYVWGQQGLDDVITQLMEQTRGSTAPPAASDEDIAALEKFSRKDIKKFLQARNRECSTCMDSFEDEPTEQQNDKGMDSNRPVGATAISEEDPPEVLPGEDQQQDELVMMPCKHLFHQDCLIPWLKTSGTCPVCRIQLPSTKERSSEARNSTTDIGFNPQMDNHNTRATSSSAIIEEREDTDVSDDYGPSDNYNRNDNHDQSDNYGQNDDLLEELYQQDISYNERESRQLLEERRERSRKAAESRRQRQEQENNEQTIPGSFISTEDLD